MNREKEVRKENKKFNFLEVFTYKCILRHLIGLENLNNIALLIFVKDLFNICMFFVL